MANPLADPGTAERTRIRHTLAVPKGIPGGVRSLTLIELTADEELQAEERAPGGGGKKAVEICKAMIAKVDGKAVSTVDGSVDAAWAGFHPKLRSLLVTAYARFHLASDEEVSGFFGSDRIEV